MNNCTSQNIYITWRFRNTLAKNEIKDTIKVIKNSENRGILFKETTEKVMNQKGKFFGLLMRIVLPLKKMYSNHQLKMPTTNATSQKKIYGSDIIILVILNEKIEDTMKIVKYLEEPGFW